MRETFGKAIQDFPYAFVLPTHGEGWDANVLPPAAPDAPARDTAGPSAEAGIPRRRAGDKRPVYIEIKPRT